MTLLSEKIYEIFDQNAECPVGNLDIPSCPVGSLVLLRVFRIRIRFLRNGGIHMGIDLFMVADSYFSYRGAISQLLIFWYTILNTDRALLNTKGVWLQMRDSILVIFLLYPFLVNGISALMGLLLYISLRFVRKKQRAQAEKEKEEVFGERVV